jgi:hypothetical protein
MTRRQGGDHVGVPAPDTATMARMVGCGMASRSEDLARLARYLLRLQLQYPVQVVTSLGCLYECMPSLVQWKLMAATLGGTIGSTVVHRGTCSRNATCQGRMQVARSKSDVFRW